MTSAAEKLQPSALVDNQSLIRDDTEMDSLTLFKRGKRHRSLERLLRAETAILSGSVERTITGASTVTIALFDPDRNIQNSGLITKETDIKIDGLYFRLASAERQTDDLTLVFEDREVSLLRERDGFRKTERDQMTRAEFAHSLVREEKRVHIRFYSPEEHFKQDIAPDPNASNTPDPLTGGGISSGDGITVAGINATPSQIKNTNIVLDTGISMGMPTVGLITAVIVINTESRARNLSGGDQDSVGIFQQRNIPPWNRRNRHNVAQAATTFFEQLTQVIARDKARGEPLFPPSLAQEVQISAFPDRYKAYEPEAETTVNAYLGGGDNLSGSSSSGNPALDTIGGGGTYEFQRGTVDDQGRITKENTWDCLNRLASEVNWRCFMVAGTVYFISDSYLFRARARMHIDADEFGIDQIDFQYDSNKKNSQVDISCHIRRWGAPPGSIVVIKDHGPIDGRWIVQDITRDLFKDVADIVLIKPLPKLPEPPDDNSTQTPDSVFVGDASGQRQAVVQAAQRVLAKRGEYTYRQFRPMAQSIFDQFAKDHTDCSAFATLCYKAGGAKDPNGFNYSGQGYTQTLWARGSLVNEQDARPGDLVFYGSRVGHRSSGVSTRHVAIYIGGGRTIEFGSTHPNEGTVHEASDFLGIRSYLD